MNETILLTSFLEPELVERIRSTWDGEVRYEPSLVPTPRYAADHGGVKPDLDAAGEARWRDLLGQAEICFDFDWWQPGELLTNCPKLRWVQATSAGIGGFVRRFGLDTGDVVFTTAAGTHAIPLAEFALTGALYLVKGVPDLLDRQRRHNWERYTTHPLHGKRVTVVGLGQIGSHVATMFAGLGTHVTGVGRPGGSKPDLPGVTVIDTAALDAVLPATDVLVLATPLTGDTHHLLDRRRLDLLPDGAILVNIARGPVVDQQALEAVLATDRLGGAALDVTDPEPLPAGSPLWDRADVLISPHSASTLASENEIIVDLFTDNLARWRDGRPLRNTYRSDLGY
ncbi:MAG TPA: D-2-hydroxyacid dehydrogenase [Pseudonocardiaceae bacterium]|jgi:phosphoglycerate dehydrogenase-like enzyme|nr:D-2-hydroxyacid dehydrogenase [Pseudonocardiaceae bacterium]